MKFRPLGSYRNILFCGFLLFVLYRNQFYRANTTKRRLVYLKVHTLDLLYSFLLEGKIEIASDQHHN